MELFKIGIGLVLLLMALILAYVIYLRVDYYLAVKEHEKAKRRQEAFFRDLRDSEL